MRILFCSQNPVVKELGAPKILIELAEGLRELGWYCKIASPEEIMPDRKYARHTWVGLFSESLKNYLLKCAREYDVIEYDYVYLPYPRAEFFYQALFVARVGLLFNHLQDNSIPSKKNYKSMLRSFIMGRREKLYCQRIMQHTQVTLNEADLVNTVNYDFKAELIKSGIPEEKIVVTACGISQNRRLLFDQVPSKIPEEPIVAFIGSFDNRKGAVELPLILENIYNKEPDVKFKLLGTGRNERYVLVNFPGYLRSRIEVESYFNSDELPRLLSSCSVGIFPSYADGFGFGALEMLAASMPVIAYDVSGPRMMLPSDYLVSPGDFKSMSAKVVDLLRDKQRLKAARIWAKERSRQFSWQRIAQETSQIYSERWLKKQEDI